jgi:plastocyanin
VTKRAALAAAIVAAAALAGAAPVVGQTHPAGAPVATEHAVAIDDAGFTPGTVVVAPGQHVIWTNGGVSPHTVTADDFTFDSGTLQPKAKFDLVAPATTGSYAYHCTFHFFMRGTVLVTTLSLEGPRAVVVGNAATVHGASPGTAAGTPVVVEAFAAGVWTPIATTTVATDGSISVSTPALTTTTAFRARIGGDISAPVNVPVVPRVTGKRAGKRTLEVTVQPAGAGKARLERLNLDKYRWAVVRQVRIGTGGRVGVRVPKAGVFRVTVLPAGGLAAASSPALRFG